MEYIFYINLDDRKIRRKNVEQQFDILGWEGERVKAIKLTNGALGCSMSHLK